MSSSPHNGLWKVVATFLAKRTKIFVFRGVSGSRINCQTFLTSQRELTLHQVQDYTDQAFVYISVGELCLWWYNEHACVSVCVYVCVCVRERESCIEMWLIDCCIGPKLCVMCYIRYEARQSRCWWWLVVVVAGPNRFWAKGKLVQVSVPPVTSGPARWKRKVWKLHWRRNAAKFCCLHQIMLLNTALPSSSSADLNKHDNCNCLPLSLWQNERKRSVLSCLVMGQRMVEGGGTWSREGALLSDIMKVLVI